MASRGDIKLWMKSELDWEGAYFDSADQPIATVLAEAAYEEFAGWVTDPDESERIKADIDEIAVEAIDEWIEEEILYFDETDDMFEW